MLMFLICTSITLVAIYSTVALRASDSLLEKMALLHPGMKLESIKAQLGQQMYEYSDSDIMLSRGSIKDRDFCHDKKLYWFVGGGPPWTVLEVYTDQKDTVIYVTWQNQ